MPIYQTRSSMMQTFMKNMKPEDLNTPVGRSLSKDLAAVLHNDYKTVELWKLAIPTVLFLGLFASGFIPGLSDTNALNMKLVGGFVGVGLPLTWKAGEALHRRFGSLSEEKVKAFLHHIREEMGSSDQKLGIVNYFVGRQAGPHERLVDELEKNLREIEGVKTPAEPAADAPR